MAASDFVGVLTFLASFVLQPPLNPSFGNCFSSSMSGFAHGFDCWLWHLGQFFFEEDDASDSNGVSLVWCLHISSPCSMPLIVGTKYAQYFDFFIYHCSKTPFRTPRCRSFVGAYLKQSSQLNNGLQWSRLLRALLLSDRHI